MKSFITTARLSLMALVCLAVPVTAQEKLEKLVDLKVKPESNKTPSIKAEFAKEKRSTPKDWIEIECELKAELSAKAADKSMKSYPELTFKYYVYLEGTGKEKKVLTGEVTHTNVPIGEKVHSVMYVTPATILAVTGKNMYSIPKAYAVEVLLNGQRVGFESSTNKTDPWWDTPGYLKVPELKTKAETPFASLYGDYYLDIKAR